MERNFLQRLISLLYFLHIFNGATIPSSGHFPIKGALQSYWASPMGDSNFFSSFFVLPSRHLWAPFSQVGLRDRVLIPRCHCGVHGRSGHYDCPPATQGSPWHKGFHQEHRCCLSHALSLGLCPPWGESLSKIIIIIIIQNRPFLSLTCWVNRFFSLFAVELADDTHRHLIPRLPSSGEIHCRSQEACPSPKSQP